VHASHSAAPSGPANGFAGCYQITDGPWRRDTVANALYPLARIATELKFSDTRLQGWDAMQSDSLPLFSIQARDSSPTRPTPFTYWQYLRVGAATIRVGTPLPFAGASMELRQVGETLQGTLKASTDEIYRDRPSEKSFPVTLRRMPCW
jgi:hypothetical protein